MNAIETKNTDETHLRLIKNEKNMEISNNKISLNTLVPEFTFLNHKGAAVKVATKNIF